MKVPTGFLRAFVAGLGFCLATTTWAAPPANYSPEFEVAPVPPGYTEGDLNKDRWGSKETKGFPSDCFCYRWQIMANAIFLMRSDAEDFSLAFGDAGDPKGTEVFNTQDMDFGFRWGAGLSAYYCCNPCNSVGVEFFGIDGWSASGEAAGNISVQFPSLPHLPVGGYGVATWDYSSKLYSTEANLRHRAWDSVWLLAGFRWIELGEELSSSFTTGGATSSYLIDVNNHLYGFQVGVLANPRRDGWGLDVWGKTGIYANSADQDTTENFAALGGGTTSVGADDTNVAFAADIGVAASRQITQRLAARIGYQVLWLEGVALAPDQLDNMNPSIAFAELDNSGGIFYHGGFAGLEYLW